MSIKDNFPSVGPSLSLNFARSKTLDPRITFARPSTSGDATYMNGNGLIVTAAADEPRFDHKYENGVVKSLGLLVEESRINQIRNNTMIGASIGTPPTNWTPINRSGLTWSITGTGTDAGVYYVDIRLSGTSNATSSPTVTFESGSQISASNGQTWSTSCFIKLVSGTTNNITQIVLAHDERSGTYLTGGNSTNFLSSINSSTTNIFSSCRYSFTRTNTNASTTFLHPYLLVTPTNGAVIDMTLRIGMPQTELGAFITSVIPTSGSTKTRSKDSVSMEGTNFSDWFNPTEGTIHMRLSSLQGPTSGYNRFLMLTPAGQNSQNNSLQFIFTNSPVGTSYALWEGGTIRRSYNKNVTGSSDKENAVFAYKSDGDTNVYVDGNSLTNSITSNGYAQPTFGRMGIGAYPGGEGTAPRITIENLNYYPRRLTNTQLQNLTK